MESTNAIPITNNEEFKKELMLKREARQRAIAAVSSEMDRLRRELEEEKTVHLQTKTMFENLQHIHENCHKNLSTVTNEFESKTDEKTQEFMEALRLTDLLKVN